MARFKKLPITANEGKLVYSDNIIDGIVLLAVKEIPFVQLVAGDETGKMRSKAIRCIKGVDGVKVDVVVKVHYSQSISEIAFRIQESVRHNVEAMTEYHISNVNVIIKGVFFDTESDKKQVSENNKTKCDSVKKDNLKCRVKNVNVYIKDATIEDAINQNIAVTEENSEKYENN